MKLRCESPACRMTPGGPVLLLVLVGAVATGCSAPNADPLTIYVVRHGEKASEAPDAELSPEGQQRAAELGWMLHHVPVDAVYSTDYRRTRGTVQPLADEHGLTIETYADERTLAGSLRERRGQTAVVCGHSNTIPRLLAELGVPIDAELLQSYDDLFIVLLRPGCPPNLQHLRYR